MKLLARFAIGSMTSGLLLVAACAGSEDPDLGDLGTAKTESEDAGGGAVLPPPSNNDAGTTPPPKDAGPADAKPDAPVNTGSAPMCPPLSDFEKIIVGAQLLTGNPPSCDQSCDPSTKCCFDILSFFGSGGTLPNVDAGGVPSPSGSATGVCIDKF